MTHARLMIGYELKFTDQHIVRVDDISFTDDSIVIAGPTLTQAASRRTHGGAGPFNIDLPLSGTAAIEPRRNGSAPQLVLTFDGAIEAVDGSADCGQEVVITNGACQNVVISGATLTVNMTYTKNQCTTATLTGLRGAGGGGAMTGDNNVSVRMHEGNVNGDTAVNLSDLQSIKGQLLTPVNAGSFRSDVTCDGSINLSDLQAVKANLLQSATCP
jgi:hypothetical protein